ncbi:MAG: PDZ domain-containing protein [Ectothiorhodospiraceae bacterium AqS1]|nr:PDZ domain-containing protein [Ectothiorhodospiraceae bacterium AqS1]|eukprot:XP_003390117.1 PREDICTED: uncharacterized protein LOC100635539 [Amphimedon queenslandica]
MKTTSIKTIPLLLIGATIGGALTIAPGVLAERLIPTLITDEEPPPGLPLEELREITEVMLRIERDYVDPIEREDLIQNAIGGMLSGLDPHSSYIVPDGMKNLQEQTRGEFGGLGIEVGMEDNGYVKVVAPIDDTPAFRAGMKAGDLIVRLDGKSVRGLTLTEAVNKMRGKPGTIIVLTVVRQGLDAPIDVKIKRDIIQITSVRARTLEPGYGYVRISAFQTRTANNLIQSVNRLQEESEDGLNGLILDLRNNPGGVLKAGVDVADAFLESGTIVYTEGRRDDAKLRFNADSTDVIDGKPLVVLVNGGSASASEIVAGALKDHRRAVIIGEPTFGKGSVQTILQTEGNAALKLTTARYYTPSGNSIQAQGIVPDIISGQVQITRASQEGLARLREADLAGHLESDNEDEGEGEDEGAQEGEGVDEGADEGAGEDEGGIDDILGESSDEDAQGDDAGSEGDSEGDSEGEENETQVSSLAEDDFTLYEALNLLKGLHILNNRPVNL